MTGSIVLATVGTDIHPFDRMVGWVDTWAEAHPETKVIVQYGTSVPPRTAHGIDYLDHPSLLDWAQQSAVVITHGGPATIMEVRDIHGPPLVVPRNPVLGEHVDRHQMEFCEMLHRKGDILLGRSEEHLHQLIDQTLLHPPTPCRRVGETPEGVRRFAEVVDELLRRPTRRKR